jgi:rhodanese-related sulfurtransferase
MPNQITAHELKRRLDRGEHLVLLDVREPEELVVASLPGAVHIPMGELPSRFRELDPQHEIVVICHHGVRSAHAAQFLVQRQFTRILNLSGGIDSWALTVDASVPRY